MSARAQLLDAIQSEGLAALVTLSDVRGSAPREAGAFMVVRPSGGFHGTIGGGALEWRALQLAAEALRSGGGQAQVFSQALGPDLGQCCGGRVSVRIETFDAGDTRPARIEIADAEARPTPMLLFGAGHVGRAIILALAPLPFETRWLDTRADAFPPVMPKNAAPVHLKSAIEEIRAAPTGAFILILTHSHALDFDIAAAALKERRFAYTGMIGSATKRARFERQLRELSISDADIDRLVCPIGLPGIGNKSPAVIAAGVVAQLLAQKYGPSAASPTRAFSCNPAS